MNLSKITLLLVICIVLLSTATDARKPNKKKAETGVYSETKSYVTALSRANFDKIVTKNRDSGVSIIHYYKPSDDAVDLLAKDLDKSASEMTGVFRYGHVNCEENSDICSKEGVSKTPAVKIYPPNPVPVITYEDELSAKKIVDAAGKYVPSKVKEINGTSHKRFVEDNPSVPKVFLFTEKKGTPLIYRALSNSFDKKIFLSIVRSTETELVKKYKVKNFPTILVVKTGEAKPLVYSGDIKFQPIFDFLNVHSETFVAGGDQNNANKPWLQETVPELTQKSGTDTVLKTDGKLSVIYLGKDAPEEAVKKEFELLATESRFDNFKYSWLNVAAEPAWAKVFSKAFEFPKVVVSSFGKRKKYLVHENDITAKSIGKTLDKILNGDAQFTTIKGNLPTFEH